MITNIIVRIVILLRKKYIKLMDKIFQIHCCHSLKSCGNNFYISYDSTVMGLNHIMIGDNFNAHARLKLRAFDSYEGQEYSPSVKIGNNFYAGTDCHIGTIGCITIGNNVTLASKVCIIDHSHGIGDYSDINIPVLKRRLGKKGSISIEDNVWICEGAIILSGVKIGQNSIIGANAVVTHNIPANSIAAGIPAKVIKKL